MNITLEKLNEILKFVTFDKIVYFEYLRCKVSSNHIKNDRLEVVTYDDKMFFIEEFDQITIEENGALVRIYKEKKLFLEIVFLVTKVIDIRSLI